jgi:hypothetical protein
MLAAFCYPGLTSCNRYCNGEGLEVILKDSWPTTSAHDKYFGTTLSDVVCAITRIFRRIPVKVLAIELQYSEFQIRTYPERVLQMPMLVGQKMDDSMTLSCIVELLIVFPKLMSKEKHCITWR